MEATVNRNNNVLEIAVEGRLDTLNAPVFEEKVGPIPEDIETVKIDLENLVYIASSGLRVLLSILKQVQKHGGEVILMKPNDLILDILDATGFTDIFTIEE